MTSGSGRETRYEGGGRRKEAFSCWACRKPVLGLESSALPCWAEGVHQNTRAYPSSCTGWLSWIFRLGYSIIVSLFLWVRGRGWNLDNLNPLYPPARWATLDLTPSDGEPVSCSSPSDRPELGARSVVNVLQADLATGALILSDHHLVLA